jgi:hypothetical protein
VKRLFIIDTYPIGDKEKNMLTKCIDHLYPLGYHIMIVSHLPLDVAIANKVNYVIYDHNNTFLDPHYTPFWWMDTGNFRIEIYNGGHTLPICRNMKTSINLAKALDYNQFIFMESDIIFNPDDLRRLGEMMDEMTILEKKMLFFRPEEYRDCEGSYVYETLLFGGDTYFFTKNFKAPLNLDEWLSIPMGYTLELSFYEQLHKYEEQFHLIHDHSSKIFSKSDVNLLRYGLFNVEMVHNLKENNKPLLFMINSLIIEQFKYVEVLRDGQLIHSTNLGKGHYWLNNFSFDGSTIDVIVYDDIEKSSVFLNKSFKMIEENNELFKFKGTINYK